MGCAGAVYAIVCGTEWQQLARKSPEVQCTTRMPLPQHTIYTAAPNLQPLDALRPHCGV